MKTMFWKIPAIVLTAIVLCTVAVTGQDTHEGHDGDPEALEGVMEEMGKAFKKLARAMRAPDAANLDAYKAQAAVIKKQALKAKVLVPTLAEEAGDGKEAMVAAYRKSMKEFNGLAVELERALAEADLARARAVVEKLGAAREQGHKHFKKPDDD